MAIRAVRGAVVLTADDADEMREAVIELLEEVQRRNGLSLDDFISILFTSTPDLRSAFPAAAARGVGFNQVPMTCALELDIVGALPRVVRLMAHVETERSRAEVEHVYLRGAQVLRQDLHSKEPQ